MCLHFTAREILEYATEIGQCDLVWESLEGMDESRAAEMADRLRAATETGYLTVDETGCYVLTGKGLGYFRRTARRAA